MNIVAMIDSSLNINLEQLKKCHAKQFYGQNSKNANLKRFSHHILSSYIVWCGDMHVAEKMSQDKTETERQTHMNYKHSEHYYKPSSGWQ